MSVCVCLCVSVCVCVFICLTSVFLPGSVEIVGHQVDKVHFFGEFGDFVSSIDRRFTTTNGGGQEEELVASGSSLSVEGLRERERE